MHIAIISLVITAILSAVIIVVGRISKAQQKKSERKKAAEELARIRADVALKRFKLSGLERKTKWLEEDSTLRKEESELK